MNRVHICSLLFGWLLTASLSPSSLSPSSLFAAEDDPQGVEFFEKRIRPVLVERCYRCHSSDAKSLKGGLRLDSSQAIRKGGDSGDLFAPDNVDQSLLIEAISYSGAAAEMPPGGKLPQRMIADFRRWVELGAPLPDPAASQRTASIESIDIEQGRQFWSFRPLRRIAPPEVADSAWPRKKIDYFVLRKLEQQGMHPAAPADRRMLMRRVYFDLIGLPPSFEQIDAFASNSSPDAYRRLVDRLLASPSYGERWGRYWLDVARYAEDNPTSESTCRPPRFPHHYRDWVIGALNDDLPYDEFVRRQLAADLMSGLPPSEIAALGFLGLSPVYHKEPKLSKDVISVIVADEWDERIDALTRGFLGLTVTCARCHDHKYDPITMQDYYALAGVMASTQLVEWPLVATNQDEAEMLSDVQLGIVNYKLRLDYAKIMHQTALAKNEATEAIEQSIAELQATLKSLQITKLFDGQIANAVRDAALSVNGDDPAWTVLDFQPGVSRDLPIFLRGSVTHHGEFAPRRFLEVLSPAGAKPFGTGSGRLELAQSIVDDAAALAARVIVNRVWDWHFGRPLVSTPSNFGQLGDRPSHGQLLDDLAGRLIDNGWSLKWLHREIVLSAAYRQSSGSQGQFDDADNRLLWRANRRRLDAEAWRDAVLSVAGQLDPSMGGPSSSLDDADNRRRTVYGTVSRQRPSDVLALFDFPDAKRHSDRRIETTTPLQQLYLLNGEFLQQQADLLAEAVTQQSGGGDSTIVIAMFRRVLLRDPTRQEIDSAIELVGNGGSSPRHWSLLAHALLASNEFMFVD